MHLLFLIAVAYTFSPADSGKAEWPKQEETELPEEVLARRKGRRPPPVVAVLVGWVCCVLFVG